MIQQEMVGMASGKLVRRGRTANMVPWIAQGIVALILAQTLPIALLKTPLV